MKSIALYLWKMKSNKKIRFHYDPWAPEIKGLHFIEVRFDCWNIREKLIFFFYIFHSMLTQKTPSEYTTRLVFSLWCTCIEFQNRWQFTYRSLMLLRQNFFFHLVIIFIKVVCMLMCISWLPTKTSKSGELLLEITNIQGSVARNGKLKS